MHHYSPETTIMEFIVQQLNTRLDRFLVEQFPEFSRMQIQRMIKVGDVLVNDKPILKTGFKLSVDDRVTASKERVVPLRAPTTVAPETGISFDILYEDNDILVINKPAGLMVHPTNVTPNHTLANALVARYPRIVGVGENPMRPGIVHRLDKDTSGLMVIAKTQPAFDSLKKQFLDRTVVKSYLAFVHGVPSEKEGVITFPIRPSRQNRSKKVAVLSPFARIQKSVRPAITRYRITENIHDEFALLEVVPKTGRTHQIRVHLAAIHHPVVGDVLYGAKESPLKRQFLHAAHLQFQKLDGTTATFDAPLPKELEEFLNAQKKTS